MPEPLARSRHLTENIRCLRKHHTKRKKPSAFQANTEPPTFSLLVIGGHGDPHWQKIQTRPQDRNRCSNKGGFCYKDDIDRCFFWLWLLNYKMPGKRKGKGRRPNIQNGNSSSSSSAPCNGNGKDEKKIFQSPKCENKDDQISQPCKQCEDKQTLETNVLQLTDKIQMISAEFEAARKTWELVKGGLFLQIVAAQKETEEISKTHLIAEQTWNVDKENLLSSLVRTYEKKIEDMSTQNQRVLLELESQLYDSKARIRELLENIEDHKKLWGSEKQYLQENAAELQINIDSMTSERGLLCQKNTELSIEAESLKAQLNEYKARLAQMEDERLQTGRVLQQYRTENINLQSDLNGSKARTQDLVRKIEEDKHLWDAEKSSLEGTVAELHTKHEFMASEMGSLTQKNTELTFEVEVIKNQVNLLESELNESKKRTQKLLQKGEEDQHLWDEKKSNLECTLAELQTKHHELILQLSRNNAFEEELLSTMSSLEEMKASTSKGEAQTAVAEEKDGQISDIQKQLSAMAEEKKSQLVSLQHQLSSISAGKKLIDEENKSLQTELDRTALVSEEEKVRVEGRVRELQTTVNSLKKEVESIRAIAEEKEGQLVDLQNRHSDLVEAKRCLLKKNASLLAELNRCTKVSKENARLENRCTMVSEENALLQNRVRQLETALDPLNRYIGCNNIRRRQLKSQLQLLHVKARAKRVAENKGAKQKQE